MVLLIVNLVVLMLSCSPHGKSRNIILNSVMLALSIVSLISFDLFAKKLHIFFPTVFNGSVGFGAYVFIATLAALLIINIVIAKVGVTVKYKETFVGGIPSEEYFSYVEQGMSTREIRKMMAEIDAQKKVEAALKAKEEAEAIEAEGAKLSAEAKQAELNGDSDAGAKAQKAAQVLDEAAKKAQLAASLASEAARAMESLKQFETPGEATDSEEKETVTK